MEADSVEDVFVARWDDEYARNTEGSTGSTLGVYRTLEGAKAAATDHYASAFAAALPTWNEYEVASGAPWYTCRPHAEYWYFIERHRLQDRHQHANED
ncbi:MAG TPA: hypothetical protein VNM48_03925 [Chloroflexota bacterium]|nr:hypothetical protein [Chloroflexota bacterium]